MKPDYKRELITGEKEEKAVTFSTKCEACGCDMGKDGKCTTCDHYNEKVETDKANTDVIPPASQQSSREISNRNLANRWVKGQSGNPAGGKKKERCITLILRELLGTVDEETGKTWERQIAETMVRKAASMDSTKGTASVLKEVLERVEGKVPDQLQIESHNVSIEYVPAKYLQDPPERDTID